VSSADIKRNTLEVLERISSAQAASPFKQSVSLIAVSKKQALDSMLEYYELSQASGFSCIFGENYVQEFKTKATQLPPSCECHFIGTLQSNKAKDAANLFSLIESVHSLSLLQALNKEAKILKKHIPVYLQVNISADQNKSGFAAKDVAMILTKKSDFDCLEIKGLMTITEFYDQPEKARPDFRAMRELKDSLGDEARSFDLSMGMSSDFEIAIEEGANVVRVGTAIFGQREA